MKPPKQSNPSKKSKTDKSEIDGKVKEKDDPRGRKDVDTMIQNDVAALTGIADIIDKYNPFPPKGFGDTLDSYAKEVLKAIAIVPGKWKDFNRSAARRKLGLTEEVTDLQAKVQQSWAMFSTFVKQIGLVAVPLSRELRV